MMPLEFLNKESTMDSCNEVRRVRKAMVEV